jgi:glycosyltransferase involved in cell wall biosynthesis
LPPDQAANALLPWQLGRWATEAGDTVEYIAHPPRAGGAAALPGSVVWVPRRTEGFFDRTLRLGALLSAKRMHRVIGPALDRADVVHVHSNGLLAELGVILARKRAKPVVLTLYGTEIWHYAPKRWGPDLFTRAYGEASTVTFYSERLLSRACELGLTRRHMHTVYPAVGPQFAWHDERAQADVRTALGITNRHLIVNVKRLHPLAGQRYLIEAMNEIVRTHPDTRLVICGTGPLREDLQATARLAGVERHVTFAGLVDNTVVARYCAAADLFALPTVAVEALACGTPVVSADNPGGVELNDVFGRDVTVVPKEQPLPLAKAIVQFLLDKRRTTQATQDAIARDFRPASVSSRYRAIYDEARTRASE